MHFGGPLSFRLVLDRFPQFGYFPFLSSISSVSSLRITFDVFFNMVGKSKTWVWISMNEEERASSSCRNFAFSSINGPSSSRIFSFFWISEFTISCTLFSKTELNEFLVPRRRREFDLVIHPCLSVRPFLRPSVRIFLKIGALEFFEILHRLLMWYRSKGNRRNFSA